MSIKKLALSIWMLLFSLSCECQTAHLIKDKEGNTNLQFANHHLKLSNVNVVPLKTIGNGFIQRDSFKIFCFNNDTLLAVQIDDTVFALNSFLTIFEINKGQINQLKFFYPHNGKEDYFTSLTVKHYQIFLDSLCNIYYCSLVHANLKNGKKTYDIEKYSYDLKQHKLYYNGSHEYRDIDISKIIKDNWNRTLKRSHLNNKGS